MSDIAATHRPKKSKMEKFFFSMGLGKFCQVIRTYSAGAKCTCRPHLRTYISGTI
jgi:hypothetical protein